MVALIDPAVRKNYPRFADTPWNFLKVASNLEAGFPHTRGKHIILAESVCRWMFGDRARWSRPRVPLDKMELLLHEQMHVFQRAHAGTVRLALHGPMGLHPGQDDCHLPLDRRASTAQPRCRRLPVGLSHPPPDGTQYIWPLCSLQRRPRPEADANRISRCWPFTLRPPAMDSACSNRPTAGRSIPTDERAGLSRGLSAVDQHLSSARSGGRPVCQAGALRQLPVRADGRRAAGREGEEFRPLAGLVPQEFCGRGRSRRVVCISVPTNSVFVASSFASGNRPTSPTPRVPLPRPRDYGGKPGCCMALRRRGPPPCAPRDPRRCRPGWRNRRRTAGSAGSPSSARRWPRPCPLFRSDR